MKRIPVMLVCAVLLAFGCSHTHKPKMTKFDMENVPEFSPKAAVSLINGQSDAGRLLFHKQMGHKYYTDLNTFTDGAIAITTRELTKRGGTVSADAEKSLTLAVTLVKLTTGGWGGRGYSHLHVKAGNGYEKTFEADIPSGNVYNAVDGAMARAIRYMLSDENILAYLCE